MRISRALDGAAQFFKLMIDPELYCLAWIALQNHFKKPKSNSEAKVEKKKAKAVTSL
jgi:hypothetical protein